MLWLSLYRRRFWLVALTVTCAILLLRYHDIYSQSQTPSSIAGTFQPGTPHAPAPVQGALDDAYQKLTHHEPPQAVVGGGDIEVQQESQPQRGQDEAQEPNAQPNALVEDTALEVNEAAAQVVELPSSTSKSPRVQATNPSHEATKAKVQHLIKPWSAPKHGRGNHWPPYDDYKDKDYDPNKWEQFEWETGYYAENGVRALGKTGHRATRYHPYPDYNSNSWKRKWQGTYFACKGPRGTVLGQNDQDLMRAYTTTPANFPAPFIGDANATGVNLTLCFDRYNRYGPYGIRPPAEQVTIEDWQQPLRNPTWNEVDWGSLQDECQNANQWRYKSADHDSGGAGTDPRYGLKNKQSFHPRTAILLRTWEGYDFTENDLQSFRALVTETSLLSGGEYQVFLFLNVKNQSADFYNDKAVYQEILDKNVPHEFQNMTVLWSETVLEQWYPKVGDWQVYWSQFMPLQWFSKQHAEFEYIWNWEMDVRYTGNHYAFLESMAKFAKEYPRKHMWERNQRYYIPSAHGSYAEWLNDTDSTILASGVEPIWGPHPYSADQKPIGPHPPTDNEHDDFTWGVGEEADLITLLPMWDPRNTLWDYRDKIWNFVPGVRPHFTPEDGGDVHFTHPEFINIPRRVYINTVSRFSRRMLYAMHLENEAGRNMQAEMWPATVALHHGLKAVYSPHPIWSNRKWPAWYADAIFNADDGKLAGWSQGKDSVYAHDREHNFGSWSWYFDSTFPKNLYRRWLGWASNDAAGSPFEGIGGRSFEDTGVDVEVPRDPASQVAGHHWGEPVNTLRVGGYGRMCLPAMLMHPVKKTFEGAEVPPPPPAPP
ncbi:hypothetical protein Slin15195_G023740 [Septoria linicola]|uniref:Major facilitator superfamily transporter n=1 Tax=Septoria linicola TaxID=215465 RepID=A0A9Q9AH95_9PEZI|nr:hypothetical protein Slin14017_G022820 [Septoria linicola]USW49055.1 hypothetical protein Slin15195_G023740 [Septoria linicola]